jgi:two-component system phosphate regulon sensor histidine kinase PhoR
MATGSLTAVLGLAFIINLWLAARAGTDQAGRRRLDSLAAWLRRQADDPLAALVTEPAAGAADTAEAEIVQAVASLQRACQARVGALAVEKARLEEILQALADGVLVTNREGQVVFGNAALTHMSGVHPPLEGRLPVEISRHREVDEAIQRCHQTQQSAVLEIVRRGPPEAFFEVHVGPIQPNGEALGTVTVFHDITRVRQLERVRRDFVANVSHELRTPLTAIRGYAETLADGALSDPVAGARFVRVIVSHAERLQRLLDDILDLSRLEADGFAVQPASCRMGDLLEAAIATVTPVATQKALQLVVESDSEQLVMCDPRLIGQALTNLLDNAAKYTPEGGRVSLRTRHEAAADEGGGRVVVEVSDTGIGIPSADLNRVFERFYRVDKGRSRAMGGTGLGLAIVRHIVEAHGQRVWASSTLGEGSAFYFTLAAA